MYHIRLYTFIFACLGFAACSSGELGTGEENLPVQPKEKIAVSFSSTLSLATTKTEGNTESLTTGANVTIRAYKQGGIEIPTEEEYSRRYYTVGADGSLSLQSPPPSTAPSGSSIMYLGAGTYSFYALSINTVGTAANAFPPELTGGSFSQTTELQNHTDYLYCAVNRQIASTPDVEQTVELLFGRLAARLQITIVSEGNASNRIVAATEPTIKLPLTDPAGSKITLGATASIEQGAAATGEAHYTTLNSAGNITAGFTASCILLPMKAGEVLPVRILFPSITFNGIAAQTDKLYTLDIISPTGGYASGKQYNYKVNITGNQIVFTGLSVEPWINKDGQLPNGDITEDFD